jgi:diguanylate cyclase (GGDEF)-like protein
MLLLQDPDETGVFKVFESRGFFGDKSSEFSIPKEDKIAKYLEFIKRPLFLKDVNYEFETVLPQMQELEIQAIAPLFQEEEIIGIICLGPSVTNQEYQIDVLEMLGIVTNMLSVALHNAKNFDQIKEMSYTDDMTGLHNYRFFSMRLKEEVARAARINSNLALLILDVDFFKNYNDTLGHPAGDEVLRQLSRILQSSLRDNDIVARYGGEEFAIILPSTDDKGALVLAERIRKKVEDHKFPNQEIQPNATLTISIGIALYPENAVKKKDLVVAADRALYFAKEGGRNKVVQFNKIKKQ